MLELVFAFAALSGVIVGAPSFAHAQAKAPIAYFLDKTSDGADVSNNLPANARDVIIAKVRFLEPPIWLLGRHGEEPGNDVFATKVEITEVKRGSAENGRVFEVRMGLRTDYRDFANPVGIPQTPDQLSQEYTVMIYSAEDGVRRLTSFMISSSQHARWEAEVSAYFREQSSFSTSR
ncbi:hypothetical protein [Bradyrhizobium sp. CB3481]|uniref:hypothetical protein n=1 Tax=Bradyrhizobium sp. CB3481 TaxID=3039158 RepID=UPI0024B20B04|nr:hypothetical protein [Bradyrhizobium sp. CB3481]WFU19179.1 hypothetical protein QA643_12925 [Bradyrhizobium sp. CB3481]